MEENYWNGRSLWDRRLTRRAAIRRGVLGLAGLSAAAFAACGGGGKSNSSSKSTSSGATGSAATQTAKIKRGGKLTFSQPEAYTTYDPQYGTNYLDFSIVFDSLMGIDKSGKTGPSDISLAQGVEQVDQTTFVYHLRQGVKFHDGTDFNAEAVKFSLDRMVAPQPPGQYWKSAFVNYDHVETPDNFTARLALKQPDGAFNALLSDVAGIMISPTAYNGKALDAVAWAPVGTGPYKLADHRVAAYKQYQAFPDHWHKLADGGSAALLDSMQSNEFPQAATATASFQSGELDLYSVSAADPAPGVLDNNSSYLKYANPGYSIQMMLVHDALPPTDNVDFRRALAWAIDRPTLAASLFKGTFSGKIDSFLSPLSWAYKPAANFSGYDLQKAQMFLDRSGVPEAQRVVRLSSADTQYFAAFQAAFAKIGVKVDYVSPTEAKGNTFKNLGDKPTIHLYDINLTNKVDPHLNVATEVTTTGAWNMSGVALGNMDDLVTKATSTFDLNERKALYGQIQDLQADQVYAMIPLVVRIERIWTKKSVVGVGFRPSSGWPSFRDLGFS